MKKLFLSLITLFASAFVFAEVTFTFANPQIVENNVIALDGKWDFYWGTFIDPEAPYIPSDMEVEVPTIWNIYDLPEKQKEIAKTGAGSGSYRLHIRNLKPKTDYSFTTYDLGFTAYKVFANGKPIYQSGEPCVDWTKTVLGQEFQIANFTSDDNGEAVIVFWISNKEYRKGGFRELMKIQESQNFIDSFNKDITYNCILDGILIAIVIYSLFLFIIKREKASLVLALFVVAILSRLMFSIFPLIKYFYPAIPYDVMLRFEFMSLYLAPSAYTLYISAMNEKIMKPWISYVIAAPGIVFGILDFALPIYYANRLVPYMQVFMFAVIGIDLVFLFISVFKERDLISRTLILTLVIVGLGAANDILIMHYVPLVKVHLLAPSFVVFAMAQIILLAYLQKRNMERVTELNENLKELNRAYYKFVPREFLDFLSKKDITELQVGEWRSSKMAVMSADIRNFTSISEKMSEMQVFEMLNSYLERIAPVIREYNGIIEKYLGDGIIAIFPNNAESALNCAVKMQEEMISLREDFKQKGFPEIKIGVGIHYGNVIIGTGGDNERMTEISLSNAIDVAVRTEASTKIYKKPIVATRQVLAYAADEAKKQNRKFEFKGEKISDPEESLFCIYSDKTGTEL